MNRKYLCFSFYFFITSFAFAENYTFQKLQSKNISYRELFKCFSIDPANKLIVLPFMSETTEKSVLIMDPYNTYRCIIPDLKNNSSFYCKIPSTNERVVEITLKDGKPSRIREEFFTNEIRLIFTSHTDFPHQEATELSGERTDPITYEYMINNISALADINSEQYKSYLLQIKKELFNQYTNAKRLQNDATEESINKNFNNLIDKEIKQSISSQYDEIKYAEKEIKTAKKELQANEKMFSQLYDKSIIENSDDLISIIAFHKNLDEIDFNKNNSSYGSGAKIKRKQINNQEIKYILSKKHKNLDVDKLLEDKVVLALIKKQIKLNELIVSSNNQIAHASATISELNYIKSEGKKDSFAKKFIYDEYKNKCSPQMMAVVDDIFHIKKHSVQNENNSTKKNSTFQKGN